MTEKHRIRRRGSVEQRIARSAAVLMACWFAWFALGYVAPLAEAPHLLGLIVLSILLTGVGVLSFVLSFREHINADLTLWLLVTPLFHLLGWMTQPGLEYISFLIWVVGLGGFSLLCLRRPAF